MGISDHLNDLPGKATDAAKRNPDKANEAIDKAGDAANKRTNDQHADKVDKAQEAARKHLDN
ncbi:antitoxin [Corynebacterium ulceribovis]|uniref:antitoxin n=1 Tax=Corynebacterium ulceribovis TaxID=487732 RepID=UPI00036A8C28|nr:antitoxin [Corynebacterium ulceribovis]